MGHLELAKHPQFWQQLENSLGKLKLVGALVIILLICTGRHVAGEVAEKCILICRQR